MNTWKLATLGIVTVLITALGVGLTTAWVLRPASDDSLTPRASETRYAAAPAPPRSPVPHAAPAVRATGAVRPVAASSTPEQCATTDRVWRVAKPGLVGSVVGAGLGAAGGAIANGGTAAGKGALIGGLAGAALGSAYGAYQTHQACGSVLGGSSPTDGLLGPHAAPENAVTNGSAQPASERIAVFHAGPSLPR